MGNLQMAVSANPTDPVTRLVYADWLEERDLPYEASYQRWVAFLIERDQWPPVEPLTTIPFLHLSDLVMVQASRLPPAIGRLFRGEWKERTLLAPWEIEATFSEAFQHERFIFTP